MVAAMGIGAVLAASSARAGGLQFVERAADAGLIGGHQAPFGFGLQYQIAGLAVGDFDRDGDQDVFVAGGSDGTDQLFINDGTGSFTDQASAWGVAASNLRHSGAAVGDYNNDGWLDLMVTALVEGNSEEPARNRLYRNNGNKTFTDVAQAAGVQITPRNTNDSYSSAFGDPDLDGDLDLFIAGWYGGNHLYTNNGDGTFTVEPDSIFRGDSPELVRGYSVRFTDIDNDGRPDILLAADFFTSRLYLNNGDGTYSNATHAWGAGLDSNGMGHAQGDFNNDGHIDWYVTSRIAPGGSVGSGNMLYMNNGNATFTERAVPAGVNFGEWGWGTDAADFDNDGWQDLVATNGWNGSYFSVDPTHLWINTGASNGGFTEVTNAVGITHTGQGRGLLTFDADNDGDRDILIGNHDQPLTYYTNLLIDPATQPTGPSTTNAITLFFDTSEAKDLAPDGFGVRVEITTGPLTQTRVMDGGSNYLAQSELSIHAGLGSFDMAEIVRVLWPNGTETVLADLPAGRYTIIAPNSTPVCGPADLNTDGILDLADIQLFVAAFTTQSPPADLAPPIGVWDLSDIQVFVAAFTAGCP